MQTTFGQLSEAHKAAFLAGFTHQFKIDYELCDIEDYLDDNSDIVVENISMAAAREARRSWNEMGTTVTDLPNLATYIKAQGRKGDRRGTVSIIELDAETVAYWRW